MCQSRTGSVSRYSKHAPLGTPEGAGLGPGHLASCHCALDRWREEHQAAGFAPVPQPGTLVRSDQANTLNAGHFTLFWFYPVRGVLHVSDDAVRPKPATASDRKQVAEGCYLLFLVKHQ